MRSWMIACSLGILLGSLIPTIPDSSLLPALLIPALLSIRFN
jgi:hypothetical protein